MKLEFYVESYLVFVGILNKVLQTYNKAASIALFIDNREVYSVAVFIRISLFHIIVSLFQIDQLCPFIQIFLDAKFINLPSKG